MINIGLSFYIIITQYLTLCFQETFKPWASSNWPKTTLFSWVYWIDPGLYIHHFQTQIIQIPLLVPSGKHTKNYGKSPCSMGKSTISMAIFNSYVKLPEGIPYYIPTPYGYLWIFMVGSKINRL